MKHIEDLTEEELFEKTKLVSGTFDQYVIQLAEAIGLCPGCTFNLIESYVEFLREQKDKPTEH